MTSIHTFCPHVLTDAFRTQGFVLLVKSVDRVRIVSNADVLDFELDFTKITELDQLDECVYAVVSALFPIYG